MNVVGQIYLTAVFPYPEIHFVILVSYQPFIITAIFRKHLAFECTERNGIYVTAFAVSSELRVSHSEFRA